jgi:putative thiamine transport system permease protein
LRSRPGWRRPGLLRLAPVLVPAAMALPVAAGFLGTIGPALQPGAVAGLWAWPGLPRAAALSLGTGLASTALALAVVLLILACLQDSPAFAALRRLLSPLLSVPHAAAALGLAFLIAPSGWVARALSPWATGWTTPPDALILNDPMGLALTLGLVAKEVPFLLLMALSALPQVDAPARRALAASLGYGPAAGFAFAVLPALYPLLRLPCFAVLAYGMTTVEMGMILGPGLPPPLAVQITLWMTQADLAARPLAAAGALAQLLLVLLALGLWLLAERATALALRRATLAGLRLRALDRPLRALALTLALTSGGALVLGLAGMAVWSFAGLWRFPDLLPQAYGLATWQRAAGSLTQTALATAGMGLAAAVLALALVLALLEAEARHGLPPSAPGLALLWLPLLVPQIAFLPGLQALALHSGTMGPAAAFAGHLVFVLPYVYLSLAPPFRALDPRLPALIASLGASPGRGFWRIRLPMLLRPVLTAAAVGLAVSVGQYLPTLLLGGGRIATVTTEAVALSSGGNRRLIGAYALLQMLLPALGFALAAGLPALAFRNRLGMHP